MADVIPKAEDLLLSHNLTDPFFVNSSSRPILLYLQWRRYVSSTGSYYRSFEGGHYLLALSSQWR